MKNQLDEMQEQKLLKIEHNMAWIAFWGLLAAMVIQLFVFGPELKNVAGEWLVFMAIAIYLAVGCVKNGLWDRTMRPNRKTNFLGSLIGGAVVCVLTLIFVYRNTTNWKYTLTAAALLGVITFAACFLILSLMVKLYQKRLAELENGSEDTC